MSEEIEGFKKQLQNVQAAIDKTESPEDLLDLISLEKDLKQLIELASTADEKITGDKFNDFINQKCSVPYKHHFGQSSFHNAFISSVTETDGGDIDVLVFFLNPLNLAMLPCEHYLRNRCTYDRCKYSHGETISMEDMQPYKEPQYSLIKPKCEVLAKHESGLWKRGVVTDVDLENRRCHVKLDTTQVIDSCYSDILPLESSTTGSDSDLSSDDEEDRHHATFSNAYDHNVLQVNNLTEIGQWEKYTTGIGSKIMQKLNWKPGEGLGKKKEGRLFPVSATIYLPGRSLDYNMKLKEKGHINLYTVEEKLKRDSLKHEKLSQKLSEQAQKTDLFSFLNASVFASKPSTSPKTDSVNKYENVKDQTSSQLNLNNFKIDENIKKVQKSMEKLENSLKRQGNCESVVAKNIKSQIASHQKELQNLYSQQNIVKHEQHKRKDNRKLTIF